MQPPYGGLLSSSCGGLKGHLGPKVILADGRTDNGFGESYCFLDITLLPANDLGALYGWMDGTGGLRLSPFLLDI